MSGYYRRHARLFQVASMLYLVPCSFNPKREQFEQGILNQGAFALALMSTVPFWYLDLKLMIAFYLKDLSPIMLIVGSIEIIVYVSIVSCTILHSFWKRRQFTRLMNVLFQPDWLLDRYQDVEERYDNLRLFAGTMLIILSMLSFNVVIQEDMDIRVLSISLTMKIFGVCYLTFIHRICVGAIGVRMAQLKILIETNRSRRQGQEQTVHHFVERFELYADQLRHVDDCFSFPLILVILLVLIEMVYLFFDIYETLELGRPAVIDNQETSVVQWMLRQMWQVVYVMVVLLLVTGCQRTSEQLHLTAHSVQHFDDDRSRHAGASKDIQRFLLQNLDRQTKFSACGFFNIDNAMLHMVLSSIITYMLILLQFDQMQPEYSSFGKQNSTL